MLIWNSIPTSDQTSADVVLGQPTFSTNTYNNGGQSRASLSSPNGVFSDGPRLFVSDAGNRRILVWSRIPTSNGQPATGVMGQTSFSTSLGGAVSPFNFQFSSNYNGLVLGGSTVWVNDSFRHRELGFLLGLGATLTYSRESRTYEPGPFAVTATFTGALAAPPKLALAGGAAGPSANDVTSTDMTATLDPLIWTYSRTLATGDYGTFAITLEAESDGNPLANQPAGNTFTVEAPPDTTAPTVALTYGKNAAAVGAGPLVITATFSEALATTPTLAIAAQGTVNDQTAADMTATADSKVWTFTKAIASGGDGAATVKDAAGNENAAATNATFTIDTTAPTVALTYSKAAAAVGAGNLTITATFSETLATTPKLAIEGQDTANDQATANMTATASAKVWTFTKAIASGGDGAATV
ncbi:MAG: hypothetical protein FD129_2679, partial [bacterium]